MEHVDRVDLPIDDKESRDSGSIDLSQKKSILVASGGSE